MSGTSLCQNHMNNNERAMFIGSSFHIIKLKSPLIASDTYFCG